MHPVTLSGGFMNLQATLSASTAGPDSPAPHHPITCTSRLALFDDGTFGCEHARVPPNDLRTQHCLDHSIAILIMECAGELHLVSKSPGCPSDSDP